MNDMTRLPAPAVNDTPAALIRALRQIAHFPSSVARMGLSGNDALAHVQGLAQQVLATVEKGAIQ